MPLTTTSTPWTATIELAGEISDFQAEGLAMTEGVRHVHTTHGWVTIVIKLPAEVTDYNEAMQGADPLYLNPTLASLIQHGLLTVERVTVASPTAQAASKPLMGTYEIAALLRVSPQRVSTLRKEHSGPDFEPRPGHPRWPRPVASLAGGDLYSRVDIEGWIAGWDRQTGRPPTAASAG